MTPSKRKLLAAALKRLDKPELVARLTDLADSIPEVWQALEKDLDLQPKTERDLVARTKEAIARATDFDEDEINSNFDYDYDAYERLKRHFRQLVQEDRLAIAMELSETLMREGSYQVEMSDEGLMWDDVKQCLDVVFDAVKKSPIQAVKKLVWAMRLEQSDRVALYERRLDELWNMHYPLEIWSAVANDLTRQLAARCGEIEEHSSESYRRARLLRRAETALRKANRSAEIPKLRAPKLSPASGRRNQSSFRRRNAGS